MSLASKSQFRVVVVLINSELGVSVICCCIRDYPKTSWLKTTTISLVTILWSINLVWAQWGQFFCWSCLDHSWAYSQMTSWLGADWPHLTSLTHLLLAEAVGQST